VRLDRAARRGLAETRFLVRGLRVLIRPTVGLLVTATLAATLLHERGAPDHEAPSATWAESFFHAYQLLMGQVGGALPMDPVAAAVLYLLPLVGIFFLAEGVLKLGFTVFRKGDHPEVWMSMLAGSSKGHMVVCGLGTVGFRIVEELIHLGEQVFVVERRADAEFVDQARALGAEVLIGDARAENLLRSLNVGAAKGIIIATNDDLANLEIAMDVREMRVQIPIVLRLFDQRLAQKVRHTLGIEVSLSTSALAAPLFASAALCPGVVGTHRIDDRLLVVIEFDLVAGGGLVGRSAGEVAGAHQVTVIGLRRPGEDWITQPPADTRLEPYATVQVLVDGARAAEIRSLNQPSA